MGTFSSYTYGEISTFGGSRDSEFIMVVSPQQKLEDVHRGGAAGAAGGGGTLNRNNGSSASGGVVQTEKLVLTMPKLQVCTVKIP